MDLTWSADDLAFRGALRAWLAEHVPHAGRPHDPTAGAAFDRAWQRALFDAGWAGINWPVEYGGRGLSILQQIIWYEEYARAGGPPMGFRFVALNHAGPTLIALGTEAHKTAHLQAILTGEALWCQGFSEPNAGSDLASLRTRGVVDGDELVVTGQKTWTTGADHADYQELLIRTDPDSARHKGLTWVICPMAAKGIEIHPIRKMNGRAEFCSVFYDEVRIPLSNVVGEVNGGWSTAMATLGFERGTSFVGEMTEITLRLEEAVTAAKASGAWADDETRRKLADRRAEVAALRALNYANLSRYARGDAPGAEGSITKLLTNEVARSVQELALEIAGAEGLCGDLTANPWAEMLLGGIVLSIGGGTAEIQREIIADRVLELPRSR
ncbi:acyl-CoA dehydrogenase family protein [Phenylobacterium sp.]|uniref:acyl-CoA dehydrogenase family protein n=1 Tax=Phenylobacterium sp. TaxID=1871053 RepID=UPI002DE5A035|nr:acyl-CoA dehydrogenase family protein [Phenylobacterium sp.]